MKVVQNQYEKYPFPTFNKKQLKNAITELKFYVSNLKPDTKVLDVGCGTGLYACAWSSLGCKVTGIDFSTNSRKEAKRNAEQLKLNARFIQADLFSYKDDKKYDIVFCWGVIHHTENPYLAFKKLTKFLKPNGTLLIAVYNNMFLNLRLSRWLVRSFGGKTIEDKLQFVKKHKKFLMFLTFLWKYRSKMKTDDTTLVDLFCHSHVTYHSPLEIKRWFDKQHLNLEKFGSKNWATGVPLIYDILSSHILVYRGVFCK